MVIGQKFIHKVDCELTDNAPFKHPANIESHALTYGTTIVMYPGLYEMGTMNLDGVSFEGVGNKDEVVLANFTLGASSANLVTFRNLTLRGPNNLAATNSAAFKVENGTSVRTRFENCQFTNADLSIDNQGSGLVSMFTSTSNCDRGIRSNADAAVRYSYVNGTANTYFLGATATQRTVTTLLSYSAGSNTGNTVETVLAAIS